MGCWLQVELTVPERVVGAVEQALQALGALSITLADPGGAPILEPGPGATPLWPEAIVSALLPAGTSEGTVREHLAAAVGESVSSVVFTRLQERDWVGEFREDLRPMRYGAHLWICPPGQPCPDPGGAVVVLEPGLAFGSGTHPTTALCLTWLAGLALEGRAVLDWGCGSGVLAIAALSLGARAATALDIDPQALEATRANAERNARTSRLVVCDPARLPAMALFDVLVANILADSLIALAPRLRRHCAAGACVALSGILQSQAARVRDACSPWLDLRQAAELNEWVLLTGTPRAAPEPWRSS